MKANGNSGSGDGDTPSSSAVVTEKSVNDSLSQDMNIQQKAATSETDTNELELMQQMVPAIQNQKSIKSKTSPNRRQQDTIDASGDPSDADDNMTSSSLPNDHQDQSENSATLSSQHHHQHHHHHHNQNLQQQHAVGQPISRHQQHQHRSAPTHSQYQNPSHMQSHYHHQHHHQANMKYGNAKSDNESNVNHVILITVINPHYPITCDLIHQICCTYGKVNRIVIFKKNGVQAMVEFDNIESARRAKALLHGCDIYSGCCTLRIEYAKPVRLNVHKNDSDSFDYTDPSLDVGTSNSELNQNNQQQHHHNQHNHHLSGAGTSSSHNPCGRHHPRGVGGGRRGNSSGGPTSSEHIDQFQHPQMSMDHQHVKQQNASPGSGNTLQGVGYSMGQQIVDQNQNDSGDSFHQHDGGQFNISRGSGGSSQQGSFVDSFMTTPGSHGVHNNMYSSRQDHHHHQHHPHHSRTSGTVDSQDQQSFSMSASSPLVVGPASISSQGTVMMVYGLNIERVDCDRVFNLFCLYGNVVRVKFLKSKEGCAMVQMGDVIAVDRCVSSLNKITLFGNELQISYSKQPFLHEVVQPFTLPNGSPSFKDFSNNKNNRFKNPEVASKNRILPPSKILHFFNAPYGITDDELLQVFKQTADHDPVALKIFTPRAENAKSFSGLVTFGDPIEATEALVLCNHLSMPKVGAPHPYILRLCFSPPTYT